jgi:hypothetical protein
MTDKEVKTAIGNIWGAAAAGLSEPIRIVPRWKLSLKGQEPLQSVRSTTNDKLINGLYITRISRRTTKLGMNHWEYQWKYSMVYFRSYEEGTDASNSEDKLNVLLEAVAGGFEQAGDLGLEFVDNHEELQVDGIDTIDLRVHAAQCSLTVNLTKQG